MSGVPYALLLGARYLKLPEPGARGPIWPFTWGQVSDIPQNLVPGVPHAVLLGARYLSNPRT